MSSTHHHHPPTIVYLVFTQPTFHIHHHSLFAFVLRILRSTYTPFTQLSTKDQHPRNSTQRGGMRGRAAPAQQVQNHQYQHDQNLLRQLARSPAAGNGGVPAEREGVPITSLSAFFVPGGAGAETTGGRVMVAAGWEDGHWAATPCFVADTGGAGCVPSRGVGNGRGRGVTGPGEVRGDTGALASGAVLHIVHQVLFLCTQGKQNFGVD